MRCIYMKQAERFKEIEYLLKTYIYHFYDMKFKTTTFEEFEAIGLNLCEKILINNLRVKNGQ